MGGETEKDDTIVAIATPHGEGGIGVVRLSGPESLKFTNKIFKAKSDKNKFESHKARYGELREPKTNELIDDALVTYMAAPNSYTGEDVVEISCHGSPIILEKVVALAIKEEIRMAGPGEFTRRAFLNNRIDLAQAEAVLQIIYAKSEAELKFASGIFEGKLSENISRLRDELTGVRARLYAKMDFPEEDESIGRSDELKMLRKVEESLIALCDGFDEAEANRDGRRVAIVGRVNAGKSSLFNVFCGDDRAIVHQTEGTTRDTLEASITLNGKRFLLIDTAGLKTADSEIDAMGIMRSIKAAKKADIIMMVVDVSREPAEDDDEIKELLNNKTHIKILNKIDIADETLMQKHLEKWGEDFIHTSALQGTGVDKIREALTRLSQEKKFKQGFGTLRQKLAAQKSLEMIREAINLIEGNYGEELVIYEIERAAKQLDQILGVTTTEDILDRVFADFCIGK